jgi:hypothetical protein
MRTIYYEEEQNLKNNPWSYACMLTLPLGALLPRIHGIHWQVVKRVLWKKTDGQ